MGLFSHSCGDLVQRVSEGKKDLRGPRGSLGVPGSTLVLDRFLVDLGLLRWQRGPRRLLGSYNVSVYTFNTSKVQLGLQGVPEGLSGIQ